MISETTTPRGVLALCRELDIKAVALRFTDLMGRWRRITVPVTEIGEEIFEDGLAVSLEAISSSRHSQSIDLVLVPEPQTAFVDPFSGVPTLNLICDPQDPLTRDTYPLDPRGIASRAAAYLSGTGMFDQTLLGFDTEYHVFDGVRYRITEREAFHTINGGHGDTRRGQGANAGSSLAQDNLRDTYARWSAAPDPEAGFRDQVLRTVQSCGLQVIHLGTSEDHAERHAITIAPRELVTAADSLMIVKYVVKGIAKRLGRTATFMPQPLANQPGAGLSLQLSFTRSGDSIFAGHGYAGLSDQGIHAIGGLIQHAGALCALTCASTNSYRRLACPARGPRELAYSITHPTALVRVPAGSTNPRSRRIEFRAADAMCNPYLAFSAVAMAALDGAQNKFDPGMPIDEFENEHQARMGGDQMSKAGPRSLADSLAMLANDHDFLMRGNVFNDAAIHAWIRWKHEIEIATIESLPHPAEFDLYYDA